MSRFCFHSRTHHIHHIHHIDGMIISHGDNDHIGGAESMLNQMSMPLILSNVANRFLKALAERPFYVGENGYGMVFVLVSYHQKKRLRTKVTTARVCCEFRCTSRQFYYPVILRNPQKSGSFIKEPNLRATLLIAPHYGSSTSSEPFVYGVHPKYILFPTGYYNRYHFPSYPVVE
ncbi:hypothetical protein [Coxiella-like endosymbiont of Rhipicephalus sanguineus]|uniref:hypothetical protein n=1 Tax=Coxiella-like endosymbiont of Rhipicephalus sanguineus TaxID=1955402 RepID=UPI00203B80F4|nr:hypothetical protein [Coxiella-like endosymbiont of Rhipicephalus sanguineus]